jgi:glutamyl-tRNA reductase
MERLVGVEISHRHAPLVVREKITLTQDEQVAALHELHQQMPEVFILATCNRLAVYGVVSDIQIIIDFFKKFGPLEPYLQVMDNCPMAVRHLFATASGLESQALGEHEILGQIKTSYALAQKAGTLSAVMDEFIRRAMFVGKKVRKETAIGKYPVSLASVSYDILRKMHKSFHKLNVMVLGTGEMSNLMLKILAKKDLAGLYVASRSPERGDMTAKLYKAQAVAMQNVPEILNRIDVVIGATHTGKPVLMKADLPTDPKLTLIDLGLPRNFDTDIKSLENVSLYDLDDIKAITYEGLQKRQEETPKAYAIVDQELKAFAYWINTREVSPIITQYYDKLEQIREEELKWALPKLGQLDDQQKLIIESLVSRVTRRLSGKPIEKLRDFSQRPHEESKRIDTFREIFDL